MDNSEGVRFALQVPDDPRVLDRFWYYPGDLSVHTYPSHLPGAGWHGSGQAEGSQDSGQNSGGVSADSAGRLRKYNTSHF